MTRLEAEKSDFGLSWFRDINSMLEALSRHFETLNEIRESLEYTPEISIVVKPEPGKNESQKDKSIQTKANQTKKDGNETQSQTSSND